MIARPAPVRAATRAFTLVELMVAITGGLFMSLIVFALARDGSRFYQRESRVADATLASVAGLERLRGDLLRAGFMSTPNLQLDPTLCQDLDGMKGLIPELVSVAVDRPEPLAGSDADNNDLEPDRLLLSGNYTSFEQFPMLGVQAVNNGYVVDLQARIGPLARAAYPGASAEKQLEYLEQQFPAGRLLRIVNSTGRTQYGVITKVNAGDNPQVELSSLNAPLRLRAAQGCGLREIETGGAVNVVNLIRYEITRLSSTGPYAAIYSDANPYDGSRTELVRSEIDPVAGTAFEGTEEIVAEYAVNLSVGLTIVDSVTPANITALRTVAFGEEEVLDFAHLSEGTTTTEGPHRIRSVRVRLSVRSREPDRTQDIVAGGAVAPGLYRIAVGAADAGTAARPFARVRTLQADVALHNQMGLPW